ncbi:ABC transporter ATP-binding protein/permease [Fulvivirgaceae bacterium PWU4]|uniref:ABC transporter ATP-binding protein/permease n=1 Tax=Chryseosolibacter histidini TaxID=2782349 RepID=A0AAP2DMA2_9BACT|nr:ABC transporter ATP-binding protein [Chryseosolibacter histidini]MBT1698973.1 ABC transporter ATP-binding protein/permease [Chryseosolibacter histidini]
MKKNLLQHALGLIPRHQRKSGVLLILLLTLNALLDLFSLASFLPLIMIIIRPQQLSGDSLLHTLYRSSPFNDPVQFAIALTVIAVAFIFIKSAMSNWITLRKATYAYGAANQIAAGALSRYLSIPYNMFSQIDHTREMNRIATLPLTFANNFIIPAGTIVSEALITLLLLAALVFYDTRLAFFLMLVLIPFGMLYRMKRQKIRHSSEQVKQTYPLLLKHTLQAVEGLPEIRAFGKEKFFWKKFTDAFEKVGVIFSRDHVLHTGTSRVTESVAALCIGVLIIYVLVTRKAADEAVLLLSIYAGVSFRVMPSVNRIFAAVLQIRTHEYVSEELIQMGALPHEQASPGEQVSRVAFNEKIELHNITFGHEAHHALLRNASLTIHKGEKIILLGRSGSGKTTLFLLLMRFLRERSGQLLLDGKVIEDAHTPGLRKLIGYVSQNPYVLDASVLENIAFGVPAMDIDVNKVKQLVRDLDLDSWVESLPEGVNTGIGEKGVKISGGQRQRLAIARALYHDAEILLLDEVTSQLDRETEHEVMQAIFRMESKHKTIVLITHRPELWTSFDHVYELKDGCFSKAELKTFQSSF